MDRSQSNYRPALRMGSIIKGGLERLQAKAQFLLLSGSYCVRNNFICRRAVQSFSMVALNPPQA